MRPTFDPLAGVISALGPALDDHDRAGAQRLPFPIPPDRRGSFILAEQPATRRRDRRPKERNRLRTDRLEMDATPRGELAEKRAVEWLRVLADTWVNADVPEARADLLHAIHERIVVKGRSIVATQDMARPEGVGRALATYDMPIEGRDDWLAAARRLA